MIGAMLTLRDSYLLHPLPGNPFDDLTFQNGNGGPEGSAASPFLLHLPEPHYSSLKGHALHKLKIRHMIQCPSTGRHNPYQPPPHQMKIAKRNVLFSNTYSQYRCLFVLPFEKKGTPSNPSYFQSKLSLAHTRWAEGQIQSTSPSCVVI